MKTLAILFLALVPQDVPTDKDADEAIKAFKVAIKDAGDDRTIEAVRDALQTKHEKVIKLVGRLLAAGTPRVKIGTALAIGDIDHPASVDMLNAAVNANKKDSVALAAIARSLGTLGWENAAPTLNGLLKGVADVYL